MIYSNFYWHLKRVFDLFSVQYEVRSLTTFLETGRFGRTTFIFGAFPRNIAVYQFNYVVRLRKFLFTAESVRRVV